MMLSFMSDVSDTRRFKTPSWPRRTRSSPSIGSKWMSAAPIFVARMKISSTIASTVGSLPVRKSSRIFSFESARTSICSRGTRGNDGAACVGDGVGSGMGRPRCLNPVIESLVQVSSVKGLLQAQSLPARKR